MEQQHPTPKDIGGTGSVASRREGRTDEGEPREDERPPMQGDPNNDASVASRRPGGPSAGTGM